MIYAISDLHLSFENPKPMDIFGEEWSNHADAVARNWDSIVGEEDAVLIAGDTSWAMRLTEAIPDLSFIAKRPGKKYLIRGNHDYWWDRQSTNKIQRMVDPSIKLLHGTSTVIDGVGIAGTRGWRLEDAASDDPDQGDLKIHNRELVYLRRSLASLPQDIDTRIAMLHYPPFDVNLEPNDFRSVLEEYRVDILIYGHIHSTASYLEGDIGGIAYYLTSVDHIGFKPVPIPYTRS
jgi:uncharacterized protein